MTTKQMMFSILLVGLAVTNILPVSVDPIAFTLDSNSEEFPQNLPLPLEYATEILLVTGFTEEQPLYGEFLFDPKNQRVLTLNDLLNKNEMKLSHPAFDKLSTTTTPCVYNPVVKAILINSENLIHAERITSVVISMQKQQLTKKIQSLQEENKTLQLQNTQLDESNKKLLLQQDVKEQA